MHCRMGVTLVYRWQRDIGNLVSLVENGIFEWEVSVVILKFIELKFRL
jgi:hypothetical protein